MTAQPTGNEGQPTSSGTPADPSGQPVAPESDKRPPQTVYGKRVEAIHGTLFKEDGTSRVDDILVALGRIERLVAPEVDAAAVKELNDKIKGAIHDEFADIRTAIHEQIEEGLKAMRAEFARQTQASAQQQFSTPTYVGPQGSSSQPAPGPQMTPSQGQPVPNQPPAPTGPPVTHLPPPPGATPAQPAPQGPPAPVVPVMYPPPAQPKGLDGNDAIPPALLDTLHWGVVRMQYPSDTAVGRYGSLGAALSLNPQVRQQWTDQAIMIGLAFDSVVWQIDNMRQRGHFTQLRGHRPSEQLEAVRYVRGALEALAAYQVPLDILGPIAITNPWIRQAIDLGLS